MRASYRGHDAGTSAGRGSRGCEPSMKGGTWRPRRSCSCQTGSRPFSSTVSSSRAAAASSQARPRVGFGARCDAAVGASTTTVRSEAGARTLAAWWGGPIVPMYAPSMRARARTGGDDHSYR